MKLATIGFAAALALTSSVAFAQGGGAGAVLVEQLLARQACLAQARPGQLAARDPAA